MASGNPVAVVGSVGNWRLQTLTAISTRRDDPDSFHENELQELIAGAPSVLPIREFLPSSKAAISLGREIPVDIGGGNGYIDNLLVTDDGYLVVVETKLYRNPEATRDVVAQTLQYGMALGSITLLELESRIRRSTGSTLQKEESIPGCVRRLVANSNAPDFSVVEDFEEALERHFRRGEILLLVVSDEIRIGVERVTRWLNQQGNSSPFQFGLVELKFHPIENMRVVVPRAVLKTREVSRHVIVVDIPTSASNVSATVTDEFHATSGAAVQESRAVKAGSPPMTKGKLLPLLSTEDRTAASAIMEKLEAYGFDQEGMPSTIKFGFNDSDGVFHSLANFDKSGVWVSLPKRDRERLGVDDFTALQGEVNRFTRFFRDDQLGNIDSYTGVGRYRDLSAHTDDFAAILARVRDKLNTRVD